MRVQNTLSKSLKSFFQNQIIFKYGQSLNVYSLDPFPEPNRSFQFENLVIQKSTTPQEKPVFNEKLVFGKNHTDHIFECDWEKEGWHEPHITPFHYFQMNPMNTTLHYALCCFEGMKAYKDEQGRPRLFRPNLNIRRLRRSSLRAGLPDFNGKEFLKCLKEYVKTEKDWIPQRIGYSMYVRPTAISMTDVLGVRMADHSKLFVVSSPVGPYYPSGFKPIKVWCEGRVVRAAPKGVGCFKLGSNYGPTIPISKLAEIKGYNQILWLYEDQITEVGTSNVFIYWKNEDGEDELVTPPADNLILHGVVRDSVLNMAAEMERFKVSEKKVTMHELIKALKEKRVYEMFTSGTAVTVGPIQAFYYENNEYSVPIDPELNSGKLAKELCDKLFAIMYGKVDHPWSVLCE